MRYYSSNAVDDLLKCAYCQEKFVFAVKLIPDCGNSICGKCYEDLKERTLKSKEYQCKACKGKWHKMPENGLAEIQILSKMLQLKPETKALSEQAVVLKELMNQTQSQLSKLTEINVLKEVNDHCDRLLEAVKKSIETKLSQLKMAGEEQIKEIEDYRAQLISSIGQNDSDRPSKRLKISSNDGSVGCYVQKTAEEELGDLSIDFGLFNQEWEEYFTKISKVVSEADLERAQAYVKGYEPKIHELEWRLKREAMRGNFREWHDNDSFVFQRYQLGELVHENAFPGNETPPHSLETSSVSNGQSTPHPDHYEDNATKPKNGRHLSTLVGHSKSVYDVVFTNDGVLASCYADNIIKIWPFQSNDRILDIKIPGTVASSLAILPNGWLAAGCRNGSIMIWDLVKREYVRTLNDHKSSIFKLRTLADGNLVSVAWDNTIKIWNPYLEEGALLATMTGHDIKWDVLNVGIMSNGHLVTCTNDKNIQKDCIIRVWDPKAGVEVKLILTKYRSVSAFTVLDDDRIAIGFYNGKIAIYDLKNEKELGTLIQIHYFKILSIIQLPNGNLAVCTSNRDAKIYIVDSTNGTLIETIKTGHQDKLRAFKVSPDGRVLASFSSDHKVKLWSLA